MTQEDKSLLFKDLCARLPYGVKVKTPYNDAILIGLIKRKGFKKDEYYIDAITDKQTYPIRYVKPYLRPMSSMTEKEKKELIKNFWGSHTIKDKFEEVCWYLSKHFDINGLIPKGLAIEVNESNNPYKE